MQAGNNGGRDQVGFHLILYPAKKQVNGQEIIRNNCSADLSDLRRLTHPVFHFLIRTQR